MEKLVTALKAQLNPKFLVEALVICGFGLPLASALMASVLLTMPVFPGDQVLGVLILVFSILSFAITFLYVQQQSRDYSQAQLKAEAELQEDIECYNNMMTPMERQLFHRIAYNRAQARIGFGSVYEDEPDYDNEAEEMADQQRGLDALGNR